MGRLSILEEGGFMLDASKCRVSVRMKPNKLPTLAIVSFQQDGARVGYFRLKEGQYGVWLEPPKLKTGKGWAGIYHDENKERYAALQEKAIKEYEAAVIRVQMAHELEADEPDMPF